MQKSKGAGVGDIASKSAMDVLGFRSFAPLAKCARAFVVTEKPGNNDDLHEKNLKLLRQQQTGHWIVKEGRVRKTDAMFLLLPARNSSDGYPRILYAGVVKKQDAANGRTLFTVEKFLRLGLVKHNVQAFFCGVTPPQGDRVFEVKKWRSEKETVPEALEKEQAEGQGFLLDSKLRLALELYAMDAATKYFKKMNYVCEDRSKKNPYDLHCQRGKESLHVEVKGTQTKGDQIFLTNGEVEFARQNKGKMALFVLHSIRVSEDSGKCDGGEQMLIQPWDVDNGWLTPVSFTFRIPDM